MKIRSHDAKSFNLASSAGDKLIRVRSLPDLANGPGGVKQVGVSTDLGVYSSNTDIISSLRDTHLRVLNLQRRQNLGLEASKIYELFLKSMLIFISFRIIHETNIRPNFISNK
jgi:hypothetical protein